MKPQSSIQKGKTIFALKQKIVLSLNKLSDRDTYQLGSLELERIAQSLSSESISPFLSCIADTDSEAKSLVRKECVRLMGVLGISHGPLLTPHIPKIIASIVKRLKDSDSVVREACVETCGVLAKNVGDSEGIFVILARPLFEALGEQNRYAQAGGALCLARVLDEIDEVPNGVLPQMLVRVVKLLKNPHFMAKPAVIELIRSIIQAGGVSTETALSSALTSILEALKNRDWNTRKSASIALSQIAVSCSYMLSPFKSSALRSLESSRFDKVKPVRDSVIHAIQCWKSVSGSDSLEASEAGSSTKENFYNDYTDVTSTSQNGSRSSSFRKNVTISNANSVSNFSSFSNGNKNSNNNSAKRTPLSLKNPIIPNNPKPISDWQIEVSVPNRKTVLPLQIKEAEMEMDMEIDEEYSEIGSRSCMTKDITIEGEFNNSNSNLGSNSNLNLNRNDNEEGEVEMEVESRNRDLDSNSNSNLNLNESGFQNELVLIRKQLEEIQSKQANLFQLVQEFMGSSMENLATLNSKVYNMENSLDRFVHLMTQKEPIFINHDSKNYGNISVSSSPINTTYKNQPFLPSQNTKNSNDNIFSNTKSTLTNKSPQMNPKQINTENFTKRELLSSQSSFSTGDSSSISKSNSKREFDWSVKKPSFSNNEGSIELESLTKRVNGFLNEGDLESAFNAVLNYGDESRVLGLMEVTGPVLDDLSSETASGVLRVVSMNLTDRKILEFSLPWIQQVVGLSTAQDSRQLFLSPRAQRELLHSLQQVVNTGSLDPAIRITVSHLASRLAKAFGPVQLRKMPLRGAKVAESFVSAGV
ncbi:hypothetical protein LUZ60_002196 [Juncus effusus]|nr:hypothetical protein LUZ60_002196 [Juncus effusus]